MAQKLTAQERADLQIQHIPIVLEDVKHIRDGANLSALFSFCDSCKNPQ